MKQIEPSLPPHSALEEQIVQALERRPRVEIPADFAARIARDLPPMHGGLTLTPRRYGYVAAAACLVVLIALMVVFAHRLTFASQYWIWVESTFCVQFALLAVWMVVRNFSLFRE